VFGREAKVESLACEVVDMLGSSSLSFVLNKMHPASIEGQALLYDQLLFSNPSYQIKLHPSPV
jgi:hypothetical protein